MPYFIAPRSGEKSYKNYQSTIKHGVPYDRIEPYLADEGKDKLVQEDVVYAWGNRAGTSPQWEKMVYGDTVIFYAKGELVMAGEVYYKQRHPGLALAMWPPDDNGNPWEYTFFIRNLRYIKIPMKAFNAIAGFSSNFIVQGFMPLKDDRVAKIREQYGSVEALLDAFQTEASSEMPAANERLYVNVEPTVEISLLDAASLLPKAAISTEVSPNRKKGAKVDYAARNRANAITGSKGEVLVVEEEKRRLSQSGLNDLADKVTRVSLEDDSLGYDVLSYEADGSPRHIEVKTSAAQTNTVRFFMSDNEMRKSHTLPNYYVYYVDGINTKSPRLVALQYPFDEALSVTTDTYLLEATINR
jgi:hypothetical protein